MKVPGESKKSSVTKAISQHLTKKHSVSEKLPSSKFATSSESSSGSSRPIVVASSVGEIAGEVGAVGQVGQMTDQTFTMEQNVYHNGCTTMTALPDCEAEQLRLDSWASSTEIRVNGIGMGGEVSQMDGELSVPIDFDLSACSMLDDASYSNIVWQIADENFHLNCASKYLVNVIVLSVFF